MKVNEDWTSIVTALKAASDAGTWAFWRERFNTNHPDHIRQQEIDNPQQFAYANWVAAKHLYCINKDALDKHLAHLINGAEAYPGITQEVEFFMAMKRVVEEEMSQQLEQQILEDDFDIELTDEEEDDEDARYIRDNQSHNDDDGPGDDIWDGDDYLGDEEEFDDEEGYDFDLNEEEI